MTYSFAIIITYIESTFLALKPVEVVYWCAVLLFVLYILSAVCVWLIAKIVNRPFEKATPQPSQIFIELSESVRTILIFSIAWVIPWAMINVELAAFAHRISVVSVLIESLSLVIWYDVHYYIVHRLIHNNLKSTQDTHHNHAVSTPLNAYNISVVEAILLSTSLPIAMLIHDFSILSMIIMVIWSVIINTLAHANCNLPPIVSNYLLLDFIKHHALHHQDPTSNFGLFITRLDKWLNTYNNQRR